jgi:hypothetical protein
MEDIITKYIECKHKENVDNNNYILQLKNQVIKDNKKILELKDQ